MQKRSRILSSIAVAAVFLGTSPASAQQQGIPAYLTTYYSDATYQTEVGHRYWSGCSYRGYPTYHLEGTQTQYWQEELAGYCDPDREPIY